MNRLPLLAGALILACANVLGGCADASDGAPEPAVSDANLTQSTITKLSDPLLESVRTKTAAATKKEASDFYGFGVAFKWSTDVAIGKKLDAEQLSFLATALLHEAPAAAREVPSSMDFTAHDVTVRSELAPALRIAAGREATALDEAIEAARASGLTVATYGPRAEFKDAKPTAGAIILVDVAHREALVLYGRRGPAPVKVDCTVTTMHSYEWEEGLSKDEYPNVGAYEVALTGDVVLDVGANAELSNAEAVAEEHKYTVTTTRAGEQVVFEARGEFLEAKLVLEGSVGTIYGDRDGNKRWNKAATLSCKR